MRDIGILIWVGLLMIGVVGSMVSSLRRQAQVRQPRQRSRPIRPAPPPPAPEQLPPWFARMAAQMQPPSPPPAVPPPPRRAAPPAMPASAVPPLDSPFPAPKPVRHAATGLFAQPGSAARAVIAAEVLGKPLGLRDE